MIGRSVEYFQVNAFTARPEGGNPGGVVIHQGMDEATMRWLARDLGPSVTAFVHDSEGARFDLRWFTRMGDEVVTFCGHATFAAGYAILKHKRPDLSSLGFATISGDRIVDRLEGDVIAMSAPAWASEEETCPASVIDAIGRAPARYLAGTRDRLLVYAPEELPLLAPDYGKLLDLGCHGFIATAQSGPVSVDFRFFCPGFDIGENEDSATGSAQSTLVPFWARELAAPRLQTRQLSDRGGAFDCTVADGAVVIRAPCRTFLSGEILLPD